MQSSPTTALQAVTTFVVAKQPPQAGPSDLELMSALVDEEEALSAREAAKLEEEFAV